MIQFDEHTFQMGWNHQLDLDSQVSNTVPETNSQNPWTFRRLEDDNLFPFWDGVVMIFLPPWFVQGGPKNQFLSRVISYNFSFRG